MNIKSDAIKVNSRVKVVRVIDSTDESMIKSKCSCIGKIGTVYNKCKFYQHERCGLPQWTEGQNIYSIKDDAGNDISRFAWFKDELELL